MLHWAQLCRGDPVVVQKAAAHRVSRLAESDASLKELVNAGVAYKLLAMLKPDVEAGVPTMPISNLYCPYELLA